jgi:hypothetical protein
VVIDGRNSFLKSSQTLFFQRREQDFPLWKRGIEGDFLLHESVLFFRRSESDAAISFKPSAGNH